MNTDVFFREAALAICSNLQIEKAMTACIIAVRNIIPVDHMFLQFYEEDLGAMRTIASASLEDAAQLDILTPMSLEIRTLIRQHSSKFKDGLAAITSPENNPITAEMLRIHHIEGSSVLQMMLTTLNGNIGSIIFTAYGEKRYNQNHVELLSLLHGPFTIAFFNLVTHREVLMLRDRLADENEYLHQELHRITGNEIIGADFGLKEVMNLVRQVSPTESPVLLSGETGTGKDVIAAAVHQASSRRSGPFIAVNCGAIPDSLIDSELFGHEKGAFTGALSMKRGRFERADKGTIFLDEIGEMPLAAQVKLLRVLQHHEIERIGGVSRIPVDIRVIAATNRNLSDLIQQGRFREDLWFRLNVFPIQVPPLRDRAADIPALVQYFIIRKAKELKLEVTPTLEPGAIDNLISYSWPGNVRELENVIERTMIISRDGKLRFALDTASVSSESSAGSSEKNDIIITLNQLVSDHIKHALDHTDGKIHGSDGAGALLGVHPNTLRNKMIKLGIPFKTLN